MARGPSFLRTLVLSGLAIAGFFFVDTFLARMEKAESRVEAERFYRAGQKALQQGNPELAAEQFRAAYAIARDNRDYERLLGEALLAAHRLPEAESTLADLLQKDGNAGAANLDMARVLVKEGKTIEGISYYHRAIYGQWAPNDLTHRRATRFELVDLLAAQHAKEALLAELLPLQEEAPDDPATQLKLGRLFIAAGSPARAAPLFRMVLRKNAMDADAYMGLADAEFAQDDYRAALRDYAHALDLRPQDAEIRSRIDACRQLLEMDPNLRGLSAEEQFKRGLALLDMVLRRARSCAGSTSPPDDLYSEADKALKRRVLPDQRASALDADLDLAEELWHFHKAVCGGSAAPSDQLLAIVMDRLTR